MSNSQQVALHGKDNRLGGIDISAGAAVRAVALATGSNATESAISTADRIRAIVMTIV